MSDFLVQVRAALSHITYKPGWRFEAWLDERDICTCETVLIYGRHRATDADHPERETELCIMHMLTILDMGAYESVLSVVYDMVRKFELHEVDEWLKVDGVCLRNPHPEKTMFRSYESSNMNKLLTLK